jgi:hypothetical protein
VSIESPSTLSYEVFVSEGPLRSGDERMPDCSPLVWSPLSTTLIYGEHDAVLADPPFTKAQVAKVGWVERMHAVVKSRCRGTPKWVVTFPAFVSLHDSDR